MRKAKIFISFILLIVELVFFIDCSFYSSWFNFLVLSLIVTSIIFLTSIFMLSKFGEKHYTPEEKRFNFLVWLLILFR